MTPMADIDAPPHSTVTGHRDRSTTTPAPVTVTGHPAAPITPTGRADVTAADRFATDHPVTGQPVTVTGHRDQVTPDRPVTAPPPAALTGQLTGHKNSQLISWSDHLTTIILSVVVTGVAAVGQINFAVWARVPSPLHLGAPFVFEFAMITFLIRGYRRGLRNLSPAPMWCIAGTIGALSVFTNVVHTGSFRAGLFFGSASAVTLILWFAKLYDSYREHLRDQGKVTTPMPKYGRSWFLFLRKAYRAMLIATAVQSDDVQQTLRLAWTWQATYKSARLKAVTRPMAKLTAWNSVYLQVGLPTIELPAAVIAQVTLTEAPPVTAAPVTAPPVTASGQVTGHRAPGQVTTAVSSYPPGPFAPTVTGHPVTVTGDRVTGDRDRPAKPVSSAPSTSSDPYVRYADLITVAQDRITDWQTRPGRIPFSELRDTFDAAFVAGELEDKPPTSKGTLLKIGWLIETLSNRKAQIPDTVWDTYFPQLDRAAVLTSD